MNEVWKLFLSLSVSGTLVIAVLFLVCRLFQKRMSRKWQYYIWLIAVMRLLIPFSGEINVVGDAWRRLGPVSGQQERMDTGSDLMSADLPQETDQTGGAVRALPGAEGGWNASRSLSKMTGTDVLHFLLEHLGMLWLAAALVLLVRKITAYQSFMTYLRTESEPADLKQMEQFGQILEAEKIRRTIGLYTNHLVSSPMMAGLFHPRVILPEGEMSGPDLYYTALHELVHYRRRDLLYKWLVQITICLHWFNPFVWLMGREVDRACELACDEAVLDRLEEGEKQDYGDTLLHAAAAGTYGRNGLGALTMHESGKLLKGRLEAILKYQRRPRWVRGLSLVPAVLLCAGAAALGAYAGPGREAQRSVSTGQEFSLSDGTRVIEREQVFYILCGGTTEEDIPSGGVAGGIGITVVYKDRYSSVLLTEDWEDWKAEAEETCGDMQAEGRMTEGDVRLILETAEKLQKREEAEEEAGRPFDNYFIQSFYYQDGYLFLMGYELKAEKVGDYAGARITLENGEELHVSFADADQRWREDPAFLEALSSLFSEFRLREGKRVSKIEHPFISRVQYVGTDVERLTAESYAAGDHGRFTVLLGELDADRQRDYLEQAFEEDDTAFFSIALGRLDLEEILTEEQVESYLSRAYEEENTACFSILADYLSREKQEMWYKRSVEENGRNSPCTLILQELLGYEEKYEDDWEWNWNW